MALRAGYYGLKKSVISKLNKLAADMAGAVVIKSIGTGLKLTAAGKLSCTVTPTSETSVDFTGCTDYIERSSVMAIEKTADSITFDYLTGQNIGARVYQELDLTLIDFVKVRVLVSSIYNSTFPVKLGLASSVANVQNGTYVSAKFNGVTTEPVDLIIDVRGLNGIYYIVFDGSGADAVFSNAKIYTQNI